MPTSRISRKGAFPASSPLLYYITDRKRLKEGTLTGCIRRALDCGVDFIQLREKDLPDRDLFKLTCRAVSLARGTKCRILVNGRADIALAAGAHGVHLPSTGLRISDIRPWLPADFCIGVSVHTLREIRNACGRHVDYVMLGHVFPTDSKIGLGPALGLDFLRKACSISSVPVFGLGGMSADLIGPVLDSGAAGVAGISLFQQRDEFYQLKRKPWIEGISRKGID